MWTGTNRWNNMLTLLNEKREDVEKSIIDRTFSSWVKQSDINCLRNGLIEILEDYGFTDLSDALHCIGYDYDSWKIWNKNWIAERSLKEIEDILNSMYIKELNGSEHLVECHNVGWSILDGEMNYIDYYADYMALYNNPEEVLIICDWGSVLRHPTYVSSTVYFKSLPSNINVLDYYVDPWTSPVAGVCRWGPFTPITEQDIINQIPLAAWFGGSAHISPPGRVWSGPIYHYPTLKYAYHTSVGE